MRNVLVFGAGASGRGHLTPRMLEFCDCYISYVDKDMRLVEALRGRSFEVVQINSDGSGDVCTVTSDKFEIFHSEKQGEINRAFAAAELVLTCVLAENLGDVAKNIAEAIRYASASGVGKDVNIVACENLNHASSLLKDLVYGCLDLDAAKYCGEHIAFPDAIISRVVPVPEDPYRIVCENYNEWYADKNNWKGDPDAVPFIEVSENLDALLERKLWIHNGGHATLGYAAWHKNYRYIHEAVRDSEIAAFTAEVMREIGDCIIHKHGFEAGPIREYEAELGHRGAIEEMRDEVRRVIRDPIRKLAIGDRIMGPLVYAYENRLKYDGLVKSVANVLNYHDANDAESVEMKNIIETSGVRAFLENKLKLGAYPDLVDKIAAHSGS